MPPKRSAFLESAIAFLMPYYISQADSIADARQEILETLSAYATRTRPEFLKAVRIIAFSMTTLDVLAEAETTEMSLSMRLRHRGCANSLDRSTTQAEKSLDQQLLRPVPELSQPVSEKEEARKDAEVLANIASVRAQLAATRRTPAPMRETSDARAQPHHPTQTEPPEGARSAA